MIYSSINNCLFIIFRWILSCAKSGKLESVDRFLIENVTDDNKMVSVLKDTSESTGNAEVHSGNQSSDGIQNQSKTGSKTSAADNDTTLENADAAEMHVDKSDIDEEIIFNKKDKNESRNDRTSQSKPDFSATGDTEVMLLGINTQTDNPAPTHDSSDQCENDKVRSDDVADKTLERHITTPVSTRSAKEADTASEDIPKNLSAKAVNKNVTAVGKAEQSSTTPALTRCKYKRGIVLGTMMCINFVFPSVL